MLSTRHESVNGLAEVHSLQFAVLGGKNRADHDCDCACRGRQEFTVFSLQFSDGRSGPTVNSGPPPLASSSRPSCRLRALRGESGGSSTRSSTRPSTSSRSGNCKLSTANCELLPALVLMLAGRVVVAFVVALVLGLVFPGAVGVKAAPGGGEVVDADPRHQYKRKPDE